MNIVDSSYKKINSNKEKEQKHPLLSRREQTRTSTGKSLEIKEEELLWDSITQAF